ncbi:FadR/GntR family transcriptional regulator [Calderihabitans maritimus]|uniref:GntR family transcriptional regulator n=1 Tax=Calderihabitans maritimus TaxID=1246530 RepID=A0A1Z5HRX7_9FIRM|nr:FCD domain-containing protein [Calderihabitans maritimus]GAW92283.1 GntR family transcriptional regulator [Calderihabitans maritimus]
MLSERRQLEMKILSIIHDGREPVGSGTISEQLRQAGIKVSEATVGRVLRGLDAQGYTERVGYQGRIITARGLEQLAELRREKEKLSYGFELIKLVHSTSKENLIDLLVARRAIEGETAYLAALNATEKEILQLHEILERQRSHYRFGIGGAEEDLKFHGLIAEMGRNKVLQAALKLIRQDGQLGPVLEYIRKEVHSSIVVDHERIAQAIADRKAEEARAAMVTHIENLMADVEKYWDQVIKKNKTG